MLSKKICFFFKCRISFPTSLEQGNENIIYFIFFHIKRESNPQPVELAMFVLAIIPSILIYLFTPIIYYNNDKFSLFTLGVAIRDPGIQQSRDIGPNIGLKNPDFNFTKNRDFRYFWFLPKSVR